MRPRSPYGVAKLAAFGLVDTLRQKHGLHASSAIAYNHESPRRPERFLPRKVVARRRGDQARPAGRARARRPGRGARLVPRARRRARLPAHARAGRAGRLHPGRRRRAHRRRARRRRRSLSSASTRSAYVRVDERLVRPSERTPPVGDITLARERLGWEPETSFEAMIEEMVHADLAALEATAA